MVDRIEGSGINPDNVISDVGSGDSEGTIEMDLETLRIEEEKINKLTEEKEKQDTPVRQWSSLFAKMQRSKATFIATPTKGLIKTKNAR